MKQLYTPLIVLVFIGITFFAMNNSVESKEERSQRLGIQAKLGTALFQHWSSYEVISDLANTQITIENITKIEEALTSADYPSMEVDDITREKLLKPINEHLLNLISILQDHYNKNGHFSFEDEQIYETIFTEVQKTAELKSEVYYVPDHQEDVRPNHNIKHFDELEKINERLTFLLSNY